MPENFSVTHELPYKSISLQRKILFFILVIFDQQPQSEAKQLYCLF